MSNYATIPGIGDIPNGDDPDVGELLLYQGSHILPSEDDPRGGSIGLAVIPSHITRDARDDQPEDGAPWPWLRLDLDVPGDDPTVILNPAQARHLAAQLTDWADSAGATPVTDQPTAELIRNAIADAVQVCNGPLIDHAATGVLHALGMVDIPPADGAPGPLTQVTDHTHTGPADACDTERFGETCGQPASEHQLRDDNPCPAATAADPGHDYTGNSTTPFRCSDCGTPKPGTGDDGLREQYAAAIARVRQLLAEPRSLIDRTRLTTALDGTADTTT